MLAKVGIPLTMAQLEAISLQGAVSALVAARQHLLAARACRQLGLDVSQARPLPLRGQHAAGFRSCGSLWCHSSDRQAAGWGCNEAGGVTKAAE